MSWMNQISQVLKQYNSASADRVPDKVEDDFDQVTKQAPPSALSDGLAAAFRSDQTPDFGQMAGQLFGSSSGQQRAGILNMLLRAAGPMILSQVLSRRANAGGSGGGGGLSDLIGMLGGGQQTQITPEQAEQIPVEAVEEIAAQAEKKDSSVIDQFSNFYAEHPTLVKSLGAAALAIALSKIAQRQQS